MSNNSLLRTAVRRSLVTSAATAAAISMVPAQAQDDTIQEVVVTGSRISVPTFAVSSGPSAAVGSSMMRTRALKCTARAMATAWRWPPERLATSFDSEGSRSFIRSSDARAASSMASSSMKPSRLVISRPRKRLATESRFSESARLW